MPKIVVQGYEINIPDVPKNEKDIYGYDKKKADQYWVRPYTLTDEEFSKLSPMQQQEIVEIETHRRVHGFYFFNNGEPTYITGDNYFYLTYWKANNGYPIFIKNQANEFLFDKLVDEDDTCFGSIKLKPRREGCTERTMSRILNKALLTFDANFGIQSKTGQDAKDEAFKRIVRSFNNIPYWMKPTISGSLQPTKELRFGKPNEIATRKKQASNTDLSKLYLNNRISWKATVANAYDGSQLKAWVGDEIGKWEEASAYETWNIVKLTLVDGFNIYGKGYLLSTIGEVSEAAADSFRQLWRESDYTQRTENGFTVSGLYRWFIPAWASVRGINPKTKKPIVDKYGDVDEEGAKMIFMNERKAKKNAHELMMYIRQYPFTIEEALNFGSSSTVFNNIRLTQRLQKLDNFEPTETRPIKYRIGNLHWINNERFTKVKFVENPEGKWKIAYFPDVAGHDKINRVYDVNGIKRAYSDSQFMMGVDPFDYDDREGDEYSKGAFLVKLKYNFYNPELSNIYCAEYCYREAYADSFYDDVIKTAFYYGAKINVERNTYGFLKWLKRNRLINFTIQRPDITKGSAYKDRDKDFGTPTSLDTTKIGIELIENYIAEPDPLVNENEKDNLEYFYFDETIRQLLSYTIKTKTKYDLVSAMIQTEIGCQSIRKIQGVKSDVDVTKNIMQLLFPKYIVRRNNQSVQYHDK